MSDMRCNDISMAFARKVVLNEKRQMLAGLRACKGKKGVQQGKLQEIQPPSKEG